MKRFLIIGTLCLTVGITTFYATRDVLHANPVPAGAREAAGYRNVVQRVLPAVVSIEARPKTTAMRTSLPGPAFDHFPGLPEAFRKELERFRKMPLPEAHGRSFGSGFIVDAGGLVLTNAHVVQGAHEIEVRLHDGRTFVTRDIKRDPKTDLALVRIDAKAALPCLKLGDSERMEIGDRVLAFGAPLGLTGTVTSGIISAKARDVHLNMYEDFLQTDAAINPGNSGGPLVNLDGEVIGINTAIRSATGGFQGIGLAISSNLARTVLDPLQKDGSVQRGYLGIQAQPLDARVAQRLGLKEHEGVVVSRVIAGTPAARAGLTDGDVLTQVSGQSIHDARQLQRLVANLTIGQEVELAVLRDGKRLSIKLTVEKQPDSFTSAAEPTAPASAGKLGARVTDLTPERAKELGYPEKTEGVVVLEVDGDSPAHAAGLARGTMIVKIDQERVKSTDELRKALAKASMADGVLLQVRTPHGGTSYVMVRSNG